MLKNFQPAFLYGNEMFVLDARCLKLDTTDALRRWRIGQGRLEAFNIRIPFPSCPPAGGIGGVAFATSKWRGGKIYTCRIAIK